MHSSFSSPITPFSRIPVAAASEHAGRCITTLGRLHALRSHGRMTFADLWSNGARLQIVHQGDACPWRIGQWLSVSGTLRPTRAGELSLWTSESQVCSQSIRAFEAQPEQGGVPPEHRYVLNPASIQSARRRSQLVHELRGHLVTEHFTEVSTPILSRQACGAAARPFTTHARALSEDLVLRLAPEAHLMRLLAAGWDRIFELGPCFRNEGISDRHQPQFDLLECYRVGDTVQDSMALLQNMMVCVLSAVSMNPEALAWRGHTLDLTRPETVTLEEAVRRHTGCATSDDCWVWLAEHGIETAGQRLIQPDNWAFARVFEEAVEELLIQPTYITRWPSCVSPLARAVDGLWADRFELYIAGVEFANGYEQERDVAVQRQRFAEQALARGHQDVMEADDQYLFAMGWGMPPVSGFGLGVDRFVQLATNSDRIQDVILFPW